jgi:ring-1,2-phenylacetyl-CoA epoxidase subunit PaaD
VVSGALAARIDEGAILSALADVPDPEIPVVSIVDLGMVHRVEVADSGVSVELLPTFIGCPALDAIRSAVEARLSTLGERGNVTFTYETPWTSDRITDAGRHRLRESGFAPPVDDPADLRCPWCGSANVALDNLFGPTQCRSLHYCRACRQPFEAFKQV